MKALRKVLAIAVVAAMVLSFATMASAADYTDKRGHWGERAIDYWSDFGVINGYPDNTFKPDNFVSRAEVAQVIVKLMRIPDDVSISNPFTDVKPDDWFYDAVIKCAAAGYFIGYDDGTMRPNNQITREETMVIVARVLRVPQADTAIKTFPDSNQISGWARPYIYGLINADIVHGYETGVLLPIQDITRAELVEILRRLVTTYAYEEGETYTGTGEGIFLVVAPGVTVTGDVDVLLIGDGAAYGEIDVKDANVNEIKLATDFATVTVYPSSTVNKSKVAVTGVDSEVVFLKDDGSTEEIIENPNPPIAPVTPSTPGTPGTSGGGTTPPSNLPTGSGNPSTPATPVYAASISIVNKDDTTKSVTKTLSYLSSDSTIELVYAQLVIDDVYASFKTTFADPYARAIMEKGKKAYADKKAGDDTAWQAYITEYFSQVSADGDLKNELLAGKKLSELGTGAFKMEFYVEQGTGSGIFIEYLVTITITQS